MPSRMAIRCSPKRLSRLKTGASASDVDRARRSTRSTRATCWAISVLPSIVDQVTRGPELRVGERAQANEHDPGERRAVPHVEVLERVLVDVQAVQPGGVGGASGRADEGGL